MTEFIYQYIAFEICKTMMPIYKYFLSLFQSHKFHCLFLHESKNE